MRERKFFIIVINIHINFYLNLNLNIILLFIFKISNQPQPLNPTYCLTLAKILVLTTNLKLFCRTGHEWLEIYNKGDEPVDLTGWKFYEDQTNHGLSAFQGDMVIEPGEYAIIADVAANFQQTYPDFTGTIIDSSWTTLNENGEEIALKNKNLEIIETFIYLPCPHASLQRIDENLNDYSENNWQIHPTANSAGRTNEFNDNTFDDNNNNDDKPDSDDQILIEPGSIVINEFVSDPVSGENEWLELYNNNEFEVDLSGWILLDGAETATKLSGIIGSNSGNPYFVIEKPKGALNNSGDAIILKDEQENIINEVYYGNWPAPTETITAPAASDPNSTARETDGIGKFTVTQTPTKGAANLITPLANAEITTTIENSEEPKIDYKSIIINEIMPNPKGSDLDEEYIELKNIGSRSINLIGYKLSDNSKIVYKISAGDFNSIFLAPNQLISIRRKISGLSLNNDNDYVKLISPEDKTLQTIKFKEEPIIPEGISYSYDGNKDWFWSTTPTENEENIITKLNHAPIIQVYCPKQALKGELIICDASDSYDLENNKLQFTWEANNQVFISPITQLQFNQTGTFTITLTLSDGYLAISQNFKIKIVDPNKNETSQTNNTSIKISAVKNIEGSMDNNAGEIDLKMVKNLPNGIKVTTQGVVSALPNTFGKTIMYLSGSGIQLYMSKADWPDLQIGDLIEINGTIGESQGNKRLKVASAENIKIIDKESAPEPHAMTIKDINDNIIDYLIKIEGVLIEKNSNKFYIQDETGEAEIYINANTKINKGNYHEGDILSVTGILRKYNSVFQIMPRFQEDIVKEFPTASEEPVNLPATKQTNSILKYLIATAMILGLGVGMTYGFKRKRESSLNTETQSTK